MMGPHAGTAARFSRRGALLAAAVAIFAVAGVIGLPSDRASAAPGDRTVPPMSTGSGDEPVGSLTEQHAVVTNVGTAAQQPSFRPSSRRPMLAGVTLDAYAKCNAGGVYITNNSGSDLEVRLYLNGAPAFGSNPWIAVANGEYKLISGEAPAPGSTYELFQKGPGNTEASLGTVTYTPPDYCTAFVVTFTDTCDNVTVTVVSSYGSDAVFTIAQTLGSTYPVVNDLAVSAGQTRSVDVAITAEIHELGLYFDAEGDYIAHHTPKGLGNCGAAEPECASTTQPETTPPPTEPSTTPPPTHPTTTTSTVLIADTTTTTSTTTTVPLVEISIPPGLFTTTTTTTEPIVVEWAGSRAVGFSQTRQVDQVDPCTTPTTPSTPSTPSTPGGSLPATGSSTTTLATLATLLVVCGCVLGWPFRRPLP